MHNLIIKMRKYQRNKTEAAFYKTTGSDSSKMLILQRTKKGCPK